MQRPGGRRNVRVGEVRMCDPDIRGASKRDWTTAPQRFIEARVHRREATRVADGALSVEGTCMG